MSRYDRYRWKPYVTAAERRRQAESRAQKLVDKGRPASPVVIVGRGIANTFWGKAWCDNLERYSDFSNRLPRGRTYVRSGLVVDLQIVPGEIQAMVSGTRLYRVTVTIAPVTKPRWAAICKDCAGSIDSLVELLQGRLSKAVMERICQPQSGLFPAPAEIRFSCTCPDWASMCKHIAAVFYGVGARLDEEPALLFALRRVDAQDLIAKAGKGIPLAKQGPATERILTAENLAELFGLDLGTYEDGLSPGPRASSAAKKKASKTRAKPKAAAKAKPKAAAKAKPKAAAKAKPKATAKAKPKAAAKAKPKATAKATPKAKPGAAKRKTGKR